MNLQIQAVFKKIGKFLDRARPPIRGRFQTAPFSDSAAAFKKRAPWLPSLLVCHRPPDFATNKGPAKPAAVCHQP
jgi:hypothetical protein